MPAVKDFITHLSSICAAALMGRRAENTEPGTRNIGGIGLAWSPLSGLICDLSVAFSCFHILIRLKTRICGSAGEQRVHVVLNEVYMTVFGRFCYGTPDC